ncbi:MAG TPA: hypothetical protein VJU80_07080 [Solirubrobacteraceae bacterium]|nr:hypothetical protein [Solirubrobacteraceae bacterium]
MHSVSLRAAPASLIVLLLCAGCGSGSGGSSKVSASSYVKSVCSAISPLERDVVTRSSALNSSTATNATEAKQTLQGFLNAIEQDSEHAVSQIRAAGTPDISGGKTVSGAIVRTFSELRDAMKVAVTKSQALPTNSASSFNSAAQALTTSVRGSLNSIDASGLSNPDLEKAASKEPACKSLNS